MPTSDPLHFGSQTRNRKGKVGRELYPSKGGGVGIPQV